jgi:RNA polymerase sigma-70 factor (ECF subfamily)
MHTETPDIDLIQLVLAGNSSVYAQLVERHQNFVFTIVLRYIKSREDAEEVAQDVFVKEDSSILFSLSGQANH